MLTRQPAAGILLDERIDALADHGARLRIGREQARQFLDGPLEPRLGTPAQRALEQHQGDSPEADGRDARLNDTEGQTEVRRGADPETGQLDKEIDQTLHGHPAAK